MWLTHPFHYVEDECGQGYTRAWHNGNGFWLFGWQRIWDDQWRIYWMFLDQVSPSVYAMSWGASRGYGIIHQGELLTGTHDEALASWEALVADPIPTITELVLS